DTVSYTIIKLNFSIAFFFFLFIYLPLISTLFPYTTLFRSYFKDIDTSKGPLAEAAFLNQASSISAGYNFGQLTADINQTVNVGRSEEHTSELQSRENLVCRLLLEKKKKNKKKVNINEN